MSIRQFSPELCQSCPLRNGCEEEFYVAQEVSAKYVGDYEVVGNLGLFNVDIDNPVLPKEMSLVYVDSREGEKLTAFNIVTNRFNGLSNAFKKCDKPTEIKRGLFRKKVVGIGCTALMNLSD